MLIRCSECGGDVSDKASACPHCGAPVPLRKEENRTMIADTEDAAVPRNAQRRIPVGDDDEVPVCSGRCSSEPVHSFDAVNVFLVLMRSIFCILAVLILCGAVCFFVLRGNVGGIADKLRTVAESDSGDGSHIDRSGSRMFFKFYLAEFLNVVQGTESSRKPSEPARKADPPSVRSPDPLPQPKTERKPLELPPPPPEQI